MPKTRPCPRCSAPVPASSRFCQECGSTVAEGSPQPAQSKSQWMIFVAGALAIVIIVGAALTFLNANKKTANEAAAVAAGEMIKGAGPLPEWLKTAPADIVADYAWAAEHYEELRWIPCYCGCNSVGHNDNAACYFRWDKNGKILSYDSHALG